jgi:hypothetical protein
MRRKTVEAARLSYASGPKPNDALKVALGHATGCAKSSRTIGVEAQPPLELFEPSHVPGPRAGPLNQCSRRRETSSAC